MILQFQNVIGNNNCDERKPFLVTDTDEITDKEKLPILGITYGPLTHEAEKMTISIGPLICKPALCQTSEPYYHAIDNKCYYIDATSRTYYDAKRNCNTKFTLGKLFEPKSSTSNKRVHQVALGVKSGSFWLGINNKRNEVTSRINMCLLR